MKYNIKNIQIIALFFVTIFLTGCYQDEADISSPLGKDIITPTENSTDYDKEVVDFYNKYESRIAHNAEGGLTQNYYNYNFFGSAFSRQRTITYQEDKAILLKGVELFKESFVKFYDDNFGKKYFPPHIFLLDTIKDRNDDTYISEVRFNTSFISIANNRATDGLQTYTDAEKLEFKRRTNRLFWINYMLSLKELALVKENFYVLTEDLYEKALNPSGNRAVNFRELGFFFSGNIRYFDGVIDINEEDEYISPAWNDNVDAPSKTTDLEQFISAIIYNKKSDLDPILNTYPKLKQKYDILVQHFKDTYNFDLQSISGN